MKAKIATGWNPVLCRIKNRKADEAKRQANLAVIKADMKVSAHSMLLKRDDKIQNLDHLKLGKPPIVECKHLLSKWESVQKQKPVKIITEAVLKNKAMVLMNLNRLTGKMAESFSHLVKLIKNAIKAAKTAATKLNNKIKKDMLAFKETVMQSPQVLADMMMAAKYNARYSK